MERQWGLDRYSDHEPMRIVRALGIHSQISERMTQWMRFLLCRCLTLRVAFVFTVDLMSLSPGWPSFRSQVMKVRHVSLQVLVDNSHQSSMKSVMPILVRPLRMIVRRECEDERSTGAGCAIRSPCCAPGAGELREAKEKPKPTIE